MTDTTDAATTSVTQTARSNSIGKSEVAEALTNLSISEGFRDELLKHVLAPYDIKTPAEKIKKRPDGYDYVPSSYMDYQAKQGMPLYEYSLVHISFQEGWIDIIVSLKDKLTGNTELGGGAARIQVRQGADSPTFRDIIDMGNNLKSAISQAKKHAQANFGYSADVYRRRESVPTDSERDRYDIMYKEIHDISPTRANLFKEGWSGLGTDWSEFLDKWQVYIDRNVKK